MKILHTSDWHLGKKLPPYSREEEQRAVLKEIRDIAVKENVDVVLIAGDVFDVSVPSASAEEMFYTAALELSKTALVVAVAGNHDDGDRLKAPDVLAKASGIYLAGGFDCSSLGYGDVEARKGGLIYRKNGERLNLALCPYLTEARKGDAPAADFSEYVRRVLKQCADDVFDDEGCNILVSHLFMLGSETGEERELGAAKLLPHTVLPECDYIALGHIHKPMKVTDNAYYSGCILNYSFDRQSKKEVIVFDTETKEIRHIPLGSGYELRTVHARSYEEALNALSNGGNAYMKIVYDCATPLSVSQTVQLEHAGKLVQLDIVPQDQKREIKKRAHRSASELFDEYYSSLNGGENAPEELMTEFLALFNGEDA